MKSKHRTLAELIRSGTLPITKSRIAMDARDEETIDTVYAGLSPDEQAALKSFLKWLLEPNEKATAEDDLPESGIETGKPKNAIEAAAMDAADSFARRFPGTGHLGVDSHGVRPASRTAGGRDDDFFRRFPGTEKVGLL